MFEQYYVGVDVQHHALCATVVKRSAKDVLLVNGGCLDLGDNTLAPSYDQPNVVNTSVFIDALQELLRPMSKRSQHIGVSLPDAAGQIYLLRVDTHFKTRKEGGEVVRWHLRDQLPELDSGHFSLDYQVVAQRGSQKHIMAAVIDSVVLEQYETLLEQAGFAATQINFHSCALYNVYSQYKKLGTDHVFVSCDEGQLLLTSMINQVPCVLRSRPINEKPRTIFQELTRSLAKHRRNPGFETLPVYYYGNNEFSDAVKAAFDQQVLHLDSFPGKVADTFRFNELNRLNASYGMAVVQASDVWRWR